MPKVSWKQLNNIVHNIKNTLCQVDGVERDVCRRCKKLKKDLLTDLDKVHAIILEQVNGDETK